MNEIGEYHFTPEHWKSISNEQGITHILTVQSLDDEIQELRLELVEILKDIAKKTLSDRQRQYFDLMLTGITQVEMAEKLGVTQGCVNLTFWGSSHVSKYQGRRRLGGIYKKLRRQCEKDPRVMEILQRIQERRIEIYE